MFTVEHIFPFIVFSECCVASVKRSEWPTESLTCLPVVSGFINLSQLCKGRVQEPHRAERQLLLPFKENNKAGSLYSLPFKLHFVFAPYSLSFSHLT